MLQPQHLRSIIKPFRLLWLSRLIPGRCINFLEGPPMGKEDAIGPAGLAGQPPTTAWWAEGIDHATCHLKIREGGWDKRDLLSISNGYNLNPTSQLPLLLQWAPIQCTLREGGTKEICILSNHYNLNPSGICHCRCTEYQLKCTLTKICTMSNHYNLNPTRQLPLLLQWAPIQYTLRQKRSALYIKPLQPQKSREKRKSHPAREDVYYNKEALQNIENKWK